MSNNQNEYILGTGSDEYSRLAIQHRIWADATTRVWKRAGINPGSHVLDVGCGPGHASFDMAQLVTEAGRIVAVDESKRFVDSLMYQVKIRELSQIDAREGDAENLSAILSPHEKFDVIYCRWVLCWLKQPQKAIHEMRQALKPGGRIIIHDYFNWKAMTKAPRSAAIDKMVLAAVQSFEESGGDIEIAARLPQLLRAEQLVIRHFDVHQRVARGGGLDSTLAWPLTWWRSYGPKLVEMGKLSKSDLEQVHTDLNSLEQNPDHFFFCPPLFEFIAQV